MEALSVAPVGSGIDKSIHKLKIIISHCVVTHSGDPTHATKLPLNCIPLLLHLHLHSKLHCQPPPFLLSLKHFNQQHKKRKYQNRVKEPQLAQSTMVHVRFPFDPVVEHLLFPFLILFFIFLLYIPLDL